MHEVFFDTSGLASFFLPIEPSHEAARSLVYRLRARRFRFVATNYILLELIGLLTSRLRVDHRRRLAVIDAVRAAPWLAIVHVDPGHDTAAMDLLRSRPDKDWSLADCASFVVMHSRGISQALTTDHHFAQAGFVSLLA